MALFSQHRFSRVVGNSSRNAVKNPTSAFANSQFQVRT
ncbi:hypothetical protein RTM1035_11285 [Roseovarius sp. TM1035]|nr:Hypothetical protein RAK1035_3603 [Roseovarius sp. AK1035]EDM30588.1 hypothetical protein RTM1035_11285 [Roseovarius sp. TM1035]